MQTPRHRSLYQINSRVLLTELAQQLGRPATLDDIPDGRAADVLYAVRRFGTASVRDDDVNYTDVDASNP